MKVNSINNYMSNISFNAKDIANKNNNKLSAPRSQQQNSINFEESIARKADSVSANPITSLGYKLYRTFRIISEHESSAAPTQNLNVVA